MARDSWLLPGANHVGVISNWVISGVSISPSWIGPQRETVYVDRVVIKEVPLHIKEVIKYVTIEKEIDRFTEVPTQTIIIKTEAKPMWTFSTVLGIIIIVIVTVKWIIPKLTIKYAIKKIHKPVAEVKKAWDDEEEK